MHKSWGNAIWFDDAVEKMGADVMRWLYAGQAPSQNLNFGYGPANEVKQRLLTLWNSYTLLRRATPRLGGLPADVRDLEQGPPTDHAARPLARRPRSELVRECRAALDRYWHARLRARRRASGRRSLQLVRPRLARPLLASGDEATGRRVPHALVRAGAGRAPRRARHAVPGRGAVGEPRRAARAADAPRLGAPRGLPGARRGAARRRRARPRCATCRTSSSSGRRRARSAKRKLRQPLAEVASSSAAPRAGRASSQQHSTRSRAELNVKRVDWSADRPEELVERRGRAELPRARPAAGQGHADASSGARRAASTRRRDGA